MSYAALAGGTVAAALGGSGITIGLTSTPRRPMLVVVSALLLGGGAVLTALADRRRNASEDDDQDEDEDDQDDEGQWASEPLREATDAYERFHWGRRPKHVTRGTASADSILYELGKLRRVEYEAKKGREHAIYFHDFTEPFPMLTGTLDGRLGPIVGGRARVKPQGIVK